jgi:hypothetical protein
MGWTRASDLRAQVHKWWTRGELPAALVTGQALFPWRLSLRTPTSAQMTERFDEVRAWIAELREMPHCRIEMREFRHRLFGANAVPAQVWIDTEEQALALAGKAADARRLRELAGLISERQPLLLAWLSRKPLLALELAPHWPRLLDFVSWLQVHPRPGVYLRQVDLPGVHSKFVEGHRGVLAELLDIALPAEAIASQVSGASRFAERYGFRSKPQRLRFRVLDPRHGLLPGESSQDITVDAQAFSRLQTSLSRVFITENEINFLAFPALADSMVVFGAGYGFDVLAQAQWLERCRIHYWGDIDTHGFAILNQLRGRFAHAQSFLMDRATLLAFEAQWGEEDAPISHDLPRLLAHEQALYDDLRDNRLAQRLRLEQERIGFGWVEAALAAR